jgi:hypothetical protein
MLLWLIVRNKKGIQDEDVQIRKHPSIHYCLCEHGNSEPHVANRERPMSTTPEVEDILDVVDEMPRISTSRVSVQVVSLIQLSGECCENNSCNPTICSLHRPHHYKITLRE